MTVPSLTDLTSIFGSIDIYLFDQLLKGRIKAGMNLLDAGCGTGRNIDYLMQAGVTAYGVDASADAINKVMEVVAHKAPHLPPANFVCSNLENMPFSDSDFDVVLCSAVLHFSRDEAHFKSMINEMWRVLKPGGMLFMRMGTTIGLEERLQKSADRKYRMYHGPVWFLADETLLRELTYSLKADMLEPLKTVLVERERSMTTLVLRKPAK